MKKSVVTKINIECHDKQIEKQRKMHLKDKRKRELQGGKSETEEQKKTSCKT